METPLSAPDVSGYQTGFAVPKPVKKPAVPLITQLAVLLILGAAMMQVLGTVFTLVTQTQSLNDMVNAQFQGRSGMPANMGDIVQSVLLAAIVVFAAVNVAGYVVIALLIRRGMNGARVIGTVLAVLSLSALFRMSYPSDILVILRVGFGVAGMALCYVGASKAFFTGSKRYREAAKYGS
jgi:hypothetical protein